MNAILSAADTTSRLGLMPLVALGVYLALLLGLALYGYLKARLTEEDYYLAGRQQGFVITSLTIMATFFSSSAMLAVPGTVYKEGIAFMVFALNLPIAGGAVYVLGARIARVARAGGHVTPADMVADYYGNSPTVRVLVALVGVLYVVPYVVIQIRAGGHLAQQLFPNMGTITVGGQTFGAFAAGATVLSIVMMLYILVGGMRSVALADVVQGSLLLTGMLVAGYTVIAALGGPGPYVEAVSQLPPEALSLPGATGRYTAWSLMTICIFASLASIIQPAQWMRFCAARSPQALKRTSLIFSIVLPVCFLLGVMPVGLGARALYPPQRIGGELLPHPEVGRWDQALITVLRDHGVEVLGPAGPLIVAMLFIAILAASMSTADSNLHALSAVLTRDIYDRFLRPGASERERAWVGRFVIVAGSALALALVQIGEHRQDFAPLRMIIEMQFVAMAFSCQLLPVVIDMLFLHRGTRSGAIGGLIAGLLTVALFTPAPGILLGQSLGQPVAQTADYLKSLFDIGFCGLVVNVVVFVSISGLAKAARANQGAQ
ncbi:MAG: sodium:solute symporter family protein [Planctomycetes bacterium]|nr:sodium:solute symporter family protein [Planctomycetota bacterium]